MGVVRAERPVRERVGAFEVDAQAGGALAVLLATFTIGDLESAHCVFL